MKFSEHCDECILELGEPYEKVHKWLDELFAVFGPKHRRKRHNLAGVEEVRKRWGDEAAEAALLHVKSDLRMDVWNESDGVPKDEDHYVTMGLY